jgi:hypothetical protein
MRAYRAIWRTWTVLAALVGTVLCFAASGLMVSVVLFVTIATCAGVIAGNLHLLEDRPQPTPRELVWLVARAGTCAGAAGVACYGFAAEIGTDLLVLGAVLACSSPVAVEHGMRLAGLGNVESFGGNGAARELGRWSDAELYAVWCTSRAATADADQAEIAADARQELLAEFERRHPREAAEWLTSGSGLAGEPPRFLLDRRTH